MNLAALAKAGWAEASTKLQDVADYVKAHTSAQSQAQVNASLTAAKQTTSDLVSAGDSAFGDVAKSATDGLIGVFNESLVALGYSVSPALGEAVTIGEKVVLPFEEEVVYQLRDIIIGQAHALALNAIAKIGGHGVAPTPAEAVAKAA